MRISARRIRTFRRVHHVLRLAAEGEVGVEVDLQLSDVIGRALLAVIVEVDRHARRHHTDGPAGGDRPRPGSAGQLDDPHRLAVATDHGGDVVDAQPLSEVLHLAARELRRAADARGGRRAGDGRVEREPAARPPPAAVRIGSSSVRSSPPLARRLQRARPSGAWPATLICAVPAASRASIRADWPASCAVAVRFAAGTARPGPVRIRIPVADRRMLPPGCAGVPVSLARARYCRPPAGPARRSPPGRRARGASRSRPAAARARPTTSSTACRSPTRSRSTRDVAPNATVAGASSRAVSPLASTCSDASCSFLAGNVQRGRAGDLRRRAGQVSAALVRIASASCGPDTSSLAEPATLTPRCPTAPPRRSPPAIAAGRRCARSRSRGRRACPGTPASRASAWMRTSEGSSLDGGVDARRRAPGR